MKPLPAATALCFLLVVVQSGAAAVEISPSTVTITSREQAELLTITDRGQPVPASSIGSVQFLVDDHAYGHMVEIERVDGGLILRPTPELEIGTYELRVTVGNSRAVARVVASLEHYPDSLEARAAAEGVTPDEFRRRLGLYSTGRHVLQIDLPESYQLGRQVRFDIPAPERARYEWRVNGEAVESGYGPHVFEYTLRRPGEYRFEYVEQNLSGGTVHASAVTQAREPEPRVVDLSKDRAVHLLGPTGFSEYMWLIDGQIVSEQPDLTWDFDRTGRYRVECIASGANQSENIAFEKVIYEVIVH